MDRDQAERELRDHFAVDVDAMVYRAWVAGTSKMQIHRLTGLSRPAIDVKLRRHMFHVKQSTP